VSKTYETVPAVGASPDQPRAVRRAQSELGLQSLVFHTMTIEEKKLHALAALMTEPHGTPMYYRILRAIGLSDGQGGEMAIAQ
jgi:hypothetical protein